MQRGGHAHTAGRVMHGMCDRIDCRVGVLLFILPKGWRWLLVVCVFEVPALPLLSPLVALTLLVPPMLVQPVLSFQQTWLMIAPLVLRMLLLGAELMVPQL
jgi:hypothetical protein